MMYWRMRGRPACVHDRDLVDLRRIVRLVVRIPRQPRNLLHDFDAWIIALAEDCVVAVQTRIGNSGDEKLRAVGVRSRVGIRQSSRPIEREIWRSLVLEFVTRIAAPVAHWIAALNHELRDNAMKNGSVIQRHAVHLAPGGWVRPIFRA